MAGRLIALILVCCGFAACNNYNTKGESITSGELKCAVDNSYSLMMDSEIFTFKALYANTQVNVRYVPEAEALNLLLKDSIQFAVLSRSLLDEEVKSFESRQRFPESIRIAVDGLAIIVNRSNADSVFTMDQLKEVFTGNKRNWADISGSNKAGKIDIVLDHPGSCNTRYIKEKFLLQQPFPDNVFAVNTSEEVIEYVHTHPNSIGVVSVAWLSDKEDPTSQQFLSKVRVAGIIQPNNTLNPTSPRKPYQAYIYDGSYPLRRDVYAVRTGLRGSVGTGFASFLAGEKGQLIIHKMGMVAAKAPTRTIKIAE
jgi:phosphate transport system substrate-binding protein